jgi:hypothetical protein
MRSRRIRCPGLPPSYLIRLLLGLSVLAFASGGVVAQPRPYHNPVPITELQRVAALTAAQQQESTNQRTLQQWFLYNVEHFRHWAEHSAAGRSPALVNIGPQPYPVPQGAYADFLAQPMGHGKMPILWLEQRIITGAGLLGAAVTNPSTFDEAIYFPRTGAGVTIDGGVASTCWHEAQHAILGRHGLQEIPRRIWADGKSDQERREHTYIWFSERTAEWLAALTAFEDEARAAYAEELKYARNGVRITWETEHHIWRTAHDRWMALWNTYVWSRRTGKLVIPELDTALRDHYRGHTGIHMPLPDEVIAWYMGGGLTDDADHLRNTGRLYQSARVGAAARPAALETGAYRALTARPGASSRASQPIHRNARQSANRFRCHLGGPLQGSERRTGDQPFIYPQSHLQGEAAVLHPLPHRRGARGRALGHGWEPVTQGNTRRGRLSVG